jgi:hypothetical protein
LLARKSVSIPAACGLMADLNLAEIFDESSLGSLCQRHGDLSAGMHPLQKLFEVGRPGCRRRALETNLSVARNQISVRSAQKSRAYRRNIVRPFGFGHLLMMGQGGLLSHEDTVANLKLFSKAVLPRLDELGA